MAIKPTHKTVGGLPRYFFAGRKNELSVFAKTLETECGPDEYSILTISALGGQGKSSLLARMREMLKDEKYAEFPSAAIDFDLAAQRDPVNALISLRNQFNAAGIATNAFDIAFARHFLLTRPGRDIRADHPELFKFSSELLGDVVDTLGSIITELPGAKLVYSILTRLSQKGQEWYRKRGQPLLAQLDEIPAHHLRAELPMFLGADLAGYCADNSNKRLVIFYDTHEALWRGTQRIDYAAETAPDSWLRRFVQESPRVLHVVAGRRPLDWPKIDDEWSNYITSIDLRELDTESAGEIFDRAALASEPIRRRILESSQGHALTLRVNVRLYETLVSQGKTPVPEDFSLIAREAFDRFFDHLDVNTRAAIRALAIPQYIDDAVWEHLGKSGFATFELVNQSDVLGEVYFRKAEGGRYFMHELVREGLRETLAANDPALFRRLHAAMFEYHDDRSRYSPERETPLDKRDQNIEEAAAHLLLSAPERFSGWCLQRFSTDLAEISSPHRQRLLDEAQKRMGELGSTNWQDAIKLAYIEARIRPFSSASFDLITSTKPYWLNTTIDETSLSNLRNILWIYKITGQNERFQQIAQPVLALRSDEPLDASKPSFLLELLLAIESKDEAAIRRELLRTLKGGKAGSLPHPGWCVLAGILFTRDADAITYLREEYAKSDDFNRLTLLHHTLDVANEIGRDGTGIDLVCDIAGTSESELSEFLLSADTLPFARCLALLQLLKSLTAAGRDASRERAHWERLEDYFANWQEWIESRFTPSAMVPSLENSWPEEQWQIEMLLNHGMLPWEGLQFCVVDLFVTNQGEVAVFFNDPRLCWREIDYIAYRNFNVYFADRRHGLMTFGMSVNETLRRYFHEGANIALVARSRSLGKVLSGIDHPLFAFESDEQIEQAVDLSNVNSSVH